MEDFSNHIHVQGWSDHPDSFIGKFIFFPIIQPTTTEVGFSYLAYIRLSAGMKYLQQYEIHPDEKRWFVVDKEDLLQKGQAKYRDGIVPKFIHEDLKSGKCVKVIMDYSLEGYHEVDWDYISDLFGIKKDKIIWLTSVVNAESMNTESEVTVLYHNYWEQFTIDASTRNMNVRQVYEKGIKQQLQDIDNLKIRKYHGLNYNRRPHHHRIYLLSKLKSLNLIEQTSYSWGGFYLEDTHKTEIELTSEIWKEETLWNRASTGNFLDGNLDRNGLAWLLNCPVKHFPGEDLSINKADSINFDHIKDCYFQIVSETYALHNDPHVFLSEKSYKPFVSGMPFVIWGTQGMIQQLREMGYNTFDKWINHGYDRCDNSATRFTALTEEIKRLYAISPEEWSIMLKEMLPEIKQNLDRMKSYNYTNCRVLRSPVSVDSQISTVALHTDHNNIITINKNIIS